VKTKGKFDFIWVVLLEMTYKTMLLLGTGWAKAISKTFPYNHINMLCNKPHNVE